MYFSVCLSIHDTIHGVHYIPIVNIACLITRNVPISHVKNNVETVTASTKDTRDTNK